MIEVIIQGGQHLIAAGGIKTYQNTILFRVFIMSLKICRVQLFVSSFNPSEINMPPSPRKEEIASVQSIYLERGMKECQCTKDG